MLVLTRGLNEKITIFCDDKKIELVMVKFQGNNVRIGIEADKDVKIIRNELIKGLTEQ